jgi:hypothetical protein
MNRKLFFSCIALALSCATLTGCLRGNPEASTVRHTVAADAYSDLTEAAKETEALVDWAFKVNEEEAKAANLRELPRKIQEGAEALKAVNLMADAELAGKPVSEILKKKAEDEDIGN